MRQLGGAAARATVDGSAFCPRDARFQLFFAGVPSSPWTEAHGRLMVEALAPWVDERLMPNFSSPATYARCYTPAALDRLRAAAAAYDPDRVIAAVDLLDR